MVFFGGASICLMPISSPARHCTWDFRSQRDVWHASDQLGAKIGPALEARSAKQIFDVFGGWVFEKKNVIFQFVMLIYHIAIENADL